MKYSDMDIFNKSSKGFGLTLLMGSAFVWLATLPAFAITPTLDELHEKDPTAYPQTSAYTPVPTSDTQGENVYNIPEYNSETHSLTDKYYEVSIKDGVVSGTRFTNTTDKSSTNLTNHYIDQNLSNPSAHVYGAAVYNNGSNAKLGDITGDFIENTVSTTGAKYASGGAINNTSGSIGNITGDFIGNEGFSGGSYARGGAIYNTGTIGDITGKFISNTAQAPKKYAVGGAIYSTNKIGNITGEFIGNKIFSEASYTNGAAMHNSGTVGDINANFYNNSAVSEKSYARGGAIYNSEVLGNLNGNFIGNSAIAVGAADGGAIYNSDRIEDITGIFANNSIESSSSSATGGAIYNGTSAKINHIKSDFINNSAKTVSDMATGGAITVGGSIESIEGNFINNYAESQNSTSGAGAIRVYIGSAKSIKGTFIGNHSYSQSLRSVGGAIWGSNAKGIIDSIDANFINNYSTSDSGYAVAGAIDFTGTIGTITGKFEGNYAQSNRSYARGGAIDVNTVTNINADFIDNYVIGHTKASGGAIDNPAGEITNIAGNFTGNYAISETAEAIGGAINNQVTIGSLTGDFSNNYAKTSSDTHLALGGAICHTSDGNSLNLVADNRTVTFDGNYTQDYRGKINNAIFVQTAASTSITDADGQVIDYEYTQITPKVTLNATNSGEFVLNDNIDGGEVIFEDIYDGTYHGMSLERTHQYDFDISGDSTGKVQLNNDILNANITHQDVTTNVGEWTYLAHAQGEGINALTMQSGVMNIPYLTSEPVTLTSFNMNGGEINVDKIDVDLKEKKMGRFLADDYSGGSGTINVNSLNLLNTTERMKTLVPFADSSFADTVQYNGETVIAASPIFIYDVSYENMSDGGFFSFTRHKNSLNPAVLVSPVAAQAANSIAMKQAFRYVFEHLDAYTMMPTADRYAHIHRDEYAPCGTDGKNIENLSANVMDKGLWVRPYTSFDKIPFKNGPDVKSKNYGVMAGRDTNFRILENGWTNVGTVYVGYFGSKMDFDDTETYLNGGLLGLTETFYKHNFFTAFTASAGVGFVRAHTDYGKEHMNILLAGLANKTGYNIEFQGGKFIIHPLLETDYTLARPSDYKNAADVKIDNKPMQNIQLNPSVKFIGNLEGGWQPYTSIGLVYNLMNKADAKANDITLPDMRVGSYMEYNLGLQRYWCDKYSAFSQVTLRTKGRIGLELTAGFRWAF